MADNFFRPGFTQGVWLTGEPVKGLNYLAFVGNGLNNPEYLGKQDRYESAGLRQRLVGAAGSLR